MSSRVRIIGSHPAYGVSYGGRVINCIEDSWTKKFKLLDINQICPIGFQAWAHWKRALWMAKNEGGWMIRAFREPREARSSRSLYGRAFADFGIIVPKRKGKFVTGKVGYKFKVGVNKPQQRVRVIDNRYNGEVVAAVEAMDGLLGGPVAGGLIGNVAPQQPVQMRQAVAHQMNWQWQAANIAAEANMNAPQDMNMYRQIAEEAHRAAQMVEQERRRRPLFNAFDDLIEAPYDPPEFP